MPKKNMTPAEKKAWGEKMKAARAAKTQSTAKAAQSTEPTMVQDDNLDLRQTVSTLQAQLQELLAEKALERAQTATTQLQERPGFGSGGDLVGSFERYITDPQFYPDPRERLSQEARLQRFAFPFNYELTWSVNTTQYETIDNRRVKEPRFTIELVRVLKFEDLTEREQNILSDRSNRSWNPEEDTGKRYVICRGIFHEDPEAAIEIAGRNNIVVDTSNQKAFLDEMRYLRIRDWLLEAFYPAKPDAKKNKQDTVILNKLVEVYEVSAEVGESAPKIPFDTFTRKL